MRVGIDARLAYYNRSGEGRYIRELLKGLAEFRSHEEFLIFQLKYDMSSLIESEGFETRRVWSIPRMFGEGPMLTRAIRRQRLDVFHATDFFVPARAVVPLVFTVHDLYFLREPRAIDQRSLGHYRKIRTYIRNAARVICDSQSTRSDLVALTEVDETRIKVIYPGIDASDFRPVDPADGGDRTSAKFILMVGTIEPRKNVERALSAYAQVLKNHSSDAPDLVLAGKAGFCADKILSSAGRTPLRGKVHVMGPVSEENLRRLYRQASALLYPSLYEGFGFPVLEAMAAGVPVITSNVSSLPEIAGDAALYVDPLSVESISRGIERLLEDSRLKKELVEKGAQRPALFSWTTTAQSTLDVYREAAGC